MYGSYGANHYCYFYPKVFIVGMKKMIGSKGVLFLLIQTESQESILWLPIAANDLLSDFRPHA